MKGFNNVLYVILKKVGVVFAVVLFTACSLTNQKVVTPASPLPAVTVSVPVEPNLEQKLSASADRFFDAGLFLTPAEDNAYIRYRALQMLFPENTSAKSGLDAILVNEIDLVRRDLERSRLRAATQQVKYLFSLYPGSPLLVSLQRDIDNARRATRQRQPAATKNKKVDDGRIYLDIDALTQKNEKIIADLTVIAQQVKTADESIYIYARSDAEARWVYQTMRKALENYRLRGDIRIGTPAIRKLPPLQH